VLRLKTGDLLEIFDGKGGSRQARVGETGKREVEVVFAGVRQTQEQPAPAITLAVAPPKGQRMDTLVQMAQEIGLDELVPIVTDNAARQEYSENRYARWRRVAIAAAKQSGTNFLLEIAPVQDFDELLQDLKRWDLRVICHTGPECPSLREVLVSQPVPERVLLAVGPEGGFSESEAAAARKAGCLLARLAGATLRVETAAVFVLSAVCHQYNRSAGFSDK
jgi:16S rRNA (uracil1498-N3)-methyltransferase